MESAGVGGGDWQLVAERGELILREKPKDLLVAAHDAFALWRLEQVQGAAVGLVILHDLAANCWDDLYPPQRRTRARIAGFERLTDRLSGALAQDSEKLPASAEATAAPAALQDLSELLEKRLGTGQVSLGELADRKRRADAAVFLVIAVWLAGCAVRHEGPDGITIEQMPTSRNSQRSRRASTALSTAGRRSW